ncbi:MAG: alginate export family protein, partial [Planctomycetota bacterium]
GRRELLFGKQRLISPLDWANTRRTFQGVYGWVTKGQQRLDVFATRPILIDPFEFDDWNSKIGFWGVYYANEIWTCFTGEAYVLGLNRDPGTYGGVTAKENRYTLGAHLFGELPKTRFDYDVEGGYQLGTFGSADIRAWFLALDLGWKLPTRRADLWWGLGFDYASGDDGSASRQGTFNQLFPLGHAFLGFADLIGRQNVVCTRTTLKYKPVKKLTLRADALAFWRANRNDDVYNAGGGVLRAAVPGVDDKYVGAELDLTVIWAIDRHWRVRGGWSRFWTGAFIDNTGPHQDVDFYWAEVQWTF